MVIYALFFIASAAITAFYSMVMMNHFHDGYYISQYYGQLHYGIEYLLHDYDMPILNERQLFFYDSDTVSLRSITFEDISSALIEKIESQDNDIALYIALYEMSLELGHTYYSYSTFVDMLYGLHPMHEFDRSDLLTWLFVLTTCPDTYYYYDNISDLTMESYVNKYMSELQHVV